MDVDKHKKANRLGLILFIIAVYSFGYGLILAGVEVRNSHLGGLLGLIEDIFWFGLGTPIFLLFFFIFPLVVLDALLHEKLFPNSKRKRLSPENVCYITILIGFLTPLVVLLVRIFSEG